MLWLTTLSEELWFSKQLKRWCRSNGLRFIIIADAPIVTSARKLEWYSTRQLIRQFLVFLVPGTWRRREHCATWYRRPMDERERKG